MKEEVIKAFEKKLEKTKDAKVRESIQNKIDTFKSGKPIFKI